MDLFLTILLTALVTAGVIALTAYYLDHKQRAPRRELLLRPFDPLRLDIAAPGEVAVATPFRLSLALRPLGAPVLRPNEVLLGLFANAAADPPPDATTATLALHVNAPFCHVREANPQPVRLVAEQNGAGQDAPIVTFTLTPQQARDLTIRITVLQLSAPLGSAELPVVVRQQPAQPAGTAISSVNLAVVPRADTELLNGMLNDLYSPDQLQGLFFDMGIDYATTYGRSKAQKALSLIDNCQRHGRLPELLNRITAARPDLPQWLNELPHMRPTPPPTRNP